MAPWTAASCQDLPFAHLAGAFACGPEPGRQLRVPIKAEDFRLDDAGAGVVRTGHAGAQTMMDSILSLAPDVRFEILDTVEAADRVAVRWRVTGMRTTGLFDVAMIAIYRFVDGRIAEDWGVWSGKPWQTR
jgi:hypothetical protein